MTDTPHPIPTAQVDLLGADSLLPVGKRRHRWTVQEDDLIRCSYAGGEGVKSIAKALNVSAAAVSNRVAKLGVKSLAMNRTLAERFAEYAFPEPNSGCWLWVGSLSPSGYGQIRVAKRGMGSLRHASHVSLELNGSPRPGRLNALHACDNPPCVNPDHLFWGTQKDNMQDAKRKGRSVPPPVCRKGARPLKEFCCRGHKMSGKNLYYRKTGDRAYKACMHINKRARIARLIAAGLTTRGTVRLGVS